MPAALANPPPEDMIGEVAVPPARQLEDLIRLAELCVDLLRQNEEFYAEVTSHVSRVTRHVSRVTNKLYCCDSVM